MEQHEGGRKTTGGYSSLLEERYWRPAAWWGRRNGEGGGFKGCLGWTSHFSWVVSAEGEEERRIKADAGRGLGRGLAPTEKRNTLVKMFRKNTGHLQGCLPALLFVKATATKCTVI